MIGKPGCVTISYYDIYGAEKNIDIYCIQQVQDNVSVNISQTPIVTYTAENAFTFDTGAAQSFTISFIRNLPIEIDNTSSDQTKWSNAYWKTRLVECMNRWQAESDGCRLIYLPPTGADRQSIPYDIDEGTYTTGLNVYFSSLSIDFSAETNETVSGYFNLKVCSMKGNASPSNISMESYEDNADTNYFDDMQISMTSSNNTWTYSLYQPSAGINCISSATMYGGITQPFEYIEMTLRKNRMKTYCEYLITDMLPGNNKIMYNVCGAGEFILASVKTSGRNIRIMAYSKYELYNSIPLSDVFSSNIECYDGAYGRPSYIIKKIFGNSYYGVTGDKLQIPADKIHFWIDGNNDRWFGDTSDDTTGNKGFQISTKATVWQAAKICAARLRANIFIEDNNLYIIDRYVVSTSYNPDGCRLCTLNELNHIFLSKGDHNPDDCEMTMGEAALMNSVVGDVDLGSEGSNTMYNYAIMKNDDDNSEVLPAFVTGSTEKEFVDASMAFFKSSTTKISYSNLVNAASDGRTPSLNDAMAKIGAKLSYMHCDTSQSVSATIAETHYFGSAKKLGWSPIFTPFTRTAYIHDANNELYIEPKSSFDSNMTNHVKTTVSMYEHHFPEMTTTYTFGQVEQADLTQTISKIKSNRI